MTTELLNDAILADRSNRTRLLVSGPDRLKFLHNMTTQRIGNRVPGEHLEAFVTSPQGRVLGFVMLHFGPESVLVRSDPGTGPALLAHFQKYGALDDVVIKDISDQTFELTVLSRSSHLPSFKDAASWTLPERLLDLEGETLIGPVDEKTTALDALGSSVRALTFEQWDALRIEAGVPVHGKDITDANLPQEAARDARAISLNKGCYLGQETVARLDALGHVNKILRGVRSVGASEISEDTELYAGEKRVGKITSAARSLRDGRGIGIAMVRVGSDQPGVRLAAGAPGAPEVEVVTFEL